MKSVIILLGFLSVAAARVLHQQERDIDTTHLTTPEIIEAYGYPSEVHEVQTEDNYFLTIHRIPYGKNCSADKRKGAIIVQHGLFCSSADWVVLGPQQGLGFILADRCYDVWMPNNRGNHYSRKHLTLDVESAEFWNFSWHEMGIYDQPAIIDYITHITKEPKLFYTGHSQGTTQMFVLSTLRPEYTSKIKGVHAMAPIAFLSHTVSAVLKFIAEWADVVGWVAKTIGMNEFAPTDGFVNKVGQQICRDNHPDLEAMCSNILFLACGFDSAQLNKSELGVILGHTPAGIATKQLLHYAQSINSGKFRQFDYGKSENKKIYGTPEPPDYDLQKSIMKFHLIYSDNDWLAAAEDLQILRGNLGGAVASETKVPFPEFNHIDYMYAIDAYSLLYGPMIDHMDSLV